MDVQDQSRTIHLSLLVLFLGWCLTGTSVSVAESSMQSIQLRATERPAWLDDDLGIDEVLRSAEETIKSNNQYLDRVGPADRESIQPPLARAKVYLAAGDYRRAVEACQMNIDQSPSVESYVYLIYVYHALDGYLERLSKRDEWVKVGQLSLSMVNRGTMDLVDPSDLLARMAKELLHEGIRQQYDLVAGMANRLDRTRADEIWLEVRAWEKARPDNWWAGVPEQWQWEYDPFAPWVPRPEGLE